MAFRRNFCTETQRRKQLVTEYTRTTIIQQFTTIYNKLAHTQMHRFYLVTFQIHLVSLLHPSDFYFKYMHTQYALLLLLLLPISNKLAHIQ